MSSVRVIQAGKTEEFPAKSDENLLEVLRRNGFSVTAPCGGNGTCGKCRVTLVEPDGTRDEVLACQFPVLRDLRVILEEQGGGTICADTAAVWTAESREGYGAAVDLVCTECGGRMRLPAATDEDLDQLCCRYTLTIKGRG